MRAKILTIAAVILAVLTAAAIAFSPILLLGLAMVTSWDENATRYTFWIAAAKGLGVLAAPWGTLWLIARLTRPHQP
jgi:hypothetical protein